jgi:hypothetical protein
MNEDNNEFQNNNIIEIKALLISFIIVSIIITFVLFFVFSQEKKEKVNKEEPYYSDIKVPSGCVACKSESGICCPLVIESTFEYDKLSDLEIKYGCVRCDSSSGKCCPIKKEYVDEVKGGCITCSLDGEICCPIALTTEAIEKGCHICDEHGSVCCDQK